jgi:hypothetical protein
MPGGKYPVPEGGGKGSFLNIITVPKSGGKYPVPWSLGRGRKSFINILTVLRSGGKYLLGEGAGSPSSA